MTDTKLDLADYVGKGYGFLEYNYQPLMVVHESKPCITGYPFLCVISRGQAETSMWVRNDSAHITRIPQKVRLERWAVVRKDEGGWDVVAFRDSLDAAECRAVRGMRVVPCPIEFEE